MAGRESEVSTEACGAVRHQAWRYRLRDGNLTRTSIRLSDHREGPMPTTARPKRRPGDVVRQSDSGEFGRRSRRNRGRATLPPANYADRPSGMSKGGSAHPASTEPCSPYAHPVRVLLASALIVAAGCLTGVPQAGAADLDCHSDTMCYFLSPTSNISCELSTDGGPASAYCQSASSLQSVSMDADGNVVPCSGVQCMGDAAPETPTLAYGQTARLGPFGCLSATDGMTCTVASGAGFTISRAGVFPAG